MRFKIANAKRLIYAPLLKSSARILITMRIINILNWNWKRTKINKRKYKMIKKYSPLNFYLYNTSFRSRLFFSPNVVKWWSQKEIKEPTLANLTKKKRLESSAKKETTFQQCPPSSEFLHYLLEFPSGSVNTPLPTATPSSGPTHKIHKSSGAA